MNSTASVAENLAYVEQQAALAKQANVQALLLPENFAQMPTHAEPLHIEQPGEGLVQDCLKSLAKEMSMFIIAGSVPIKVKPNARPFSRSLLISDDGELIAKYDKIHLFDVDLADGQRYRESATYKPAEVDASEPVSIVDTNFAKLGLTICYDLRFPEMYRKLAQLGAQIVTVPAAFTYDTGKAHWQTLLQARAIENQVFVVAAAQVGTHQNKRQTWGHSMIIDPWGNIITQFGAENDRNSGVNPDTDVGAEPDSSTQSGVGLVIGDIDLTFMHQVRTEFPVLSHRRL